MPKFAAWLAAALLAGPALAADFRAQLPARPEASVPLLPGLRPASAGPENLEQPPAGLEPGISGLPTPAPSALPPAPIGQLEALGKPNGKTEQPAEAEASLVQEGMDRFDGALALAPLKTNSLRLNLVDAEGKPSSLTLHRVRPLENENPMSAVFYAELDRPSQPPQPVVLKFVDGAIDFMLSAEAAGSKALTEALDSGEMPRIARIRLPRYILGADSAIDASSAKELARLAAAAGKSPDIDFTHALVMEYLPGPSLDEVNLAPGDLAPLWEALRALGLNQNDVKAQNIKLPNGELSVFGLIDTSLMERTSAEDPEKQAWLTRYVASNKTLTLQPGASLSLRIGRRLLTITRQDANHLLVQTSGEERVMEVPESLPVEGVALWKDPAGDRCLRLTRLTPDSIRLVNLTDRELYVGSGRSRRPFSAITDFPR